MDGSIVTELFETRSTKQKKEILNKLIQNKLIRELIVNLIHPKSPNWQISFTKKQRKALVEKCKTTGKVSWRKGWLFRAFSRGGRPAPHNGRDTIVVGG